MKVKLLLTLTTLLALAHVARAQGTAFTYQGRLNDGANPASGTYDLRFTLLDSGGGPTVVAGPVTNALTSVSNGLFTVTLDFGAGVFSGADRWLEIGVRTNGGGAFTTLTPRQKITATPYALHAGYAGDIEPGASVSFSGGSVSFHSATPFYLGPFATNTVTGLSAQFLGGKDAGQFWMLGGNSGQLPGSYVLGPTDNQALEIRAGGGVGIGVSQPQQKLHVVGNILASGIVESLSGGVKFPDGSVQTKAALTPTRIIATVDMQFSQDDRSGWTHVETLGDDTCFGSIPLGFTYTGFGINTANISISSNGVLFFGNNCNSSFSNSALPSGISNDAMLFFFWDDLFDYGAAEYFEYATFGSPGGRVFNLYFHSRLLSSACGTDPINLMISIHEGSGLIKVNYSGFTGCPNLRGSSATLGFQTPGGSAATAFTVGVDSPVLDDNASRQTMSFHPPN